MNIDMLQQLLEMLGLAGQQDQQDPRVPPWNRNATDRPDFWRGGHPVGGTTSPIPRPVMRTINHMAGAASPTANGDWIASRLQQLAGR